MVAETLRHDVPSAILQLCGQHFLRKAGFILGHTSRPLAMSKLTSLESAVIKKLLDGKDDVLAVLRQQLEYAEVTQREVTGVGFYSTLAVPDSVGRAPRSLTVKFGDVHADMVHLRNGAGFLLYLRDGCLDLLEGYTYDEPWPQEITRFELRYDRGEARDLHRLRTLLHSF